MTFQEIYKQTEYAFAHDEVIDLLLGKAEYAYHAPQFPLAVPTNIEYIFRDGIYPFFNNASPDGKKRILSSLRCALRQMVLANDEVVVWWALSILHGQKDDESYFKKSPFEIADEFWDEIKQVLVSLKPKLSINKSFLGFNHANGLWGDVERINRLLQMDYGVVLLVGEQSTDSAIE